MADTELTARVRDYLERQIAWLRRQADCPFPDGAVSDAEMEALTQRLAEVEAHTASCQAELDALSPAWRAAKDVPGAERGEIERLAAEAERLSESVSDGYRRASSLATRKAAQVQESLRALARGRGVLHKYRVDDSDSLFIDRKA